jgi:hypothetical protein
MEHFGLRVCGLSLQSILRCKIIVVIVGIGVIEDFERLKANLNVLESVTGYAYCMGILVDRIKHALLDVMDGIGDEASSNGWVEAVCRSCECSIAGRDKFLAGYTMAAEIALLIIICI